MVLTQHSCWRRSRWGSWRSPWQPPLGPLRGLAHSAQKALVASSQLRLISMHGAVPRQHALARSFPHRAPSPSPSESHTESASRTSELSTCSFLTERLASPLGGRQPQGTALGTSRTTTATLVAPWFCIVFLSLPKRVRALRRGRMNPQCTGGAGLQLGVGIFSVNGPVVDILGFVGHTHLCLIFFLPPNLL